MAQKKEKSDDKKVGVVPAEEIKGSDADKAYADSSDSGTDEHAKEAAKADAADQ